jgi:2-dehydropantoate 2-reductase
MGAGAIGSMLGARLADDHDVALIGREPHVRAIRDRGLEVTGCTQRTVDVEAHTEPAEVGEADVVFLTVKAYQTGQALRDIEPAIGPNTFLVTLQTGLGNADQLVRRVGESHAIAGTTSHGCIFQGPGRIEHAGVGDTVVGPISPPDRPADHQLAEELTEAGIETDVVEDVRPELWAKAAVNAAINPLTAIAGLPNGALLEVPELEELMDQAAREVEAVARSEGFEVEEEAWVERAREVAEKTAKNRSSMLQDVERGRRTEIDAICGHVAEVAQRNDVPAPRNETLHALVRGIEATLTYDG